MRKRGVNMVQNERNYLGELDEISSEEQYKHVQKWLQKDPLPFLKQLRENRPVLVTSECVLIASFADICDALNMPNVFSVDLYKSKMGVTENEVGYLMAHDDGALHYREKSLMQSVLNRDDIPYVREFITKTSKKILDKAGGNIELVNDYARLCPALLVKKYFGLDGIGVDKLIEWSFWNQVDAFHNQPFDLNSEKKSHEIIEKHNEISEQLAAYIASLIVRKFVVVRIESFFRMLFSPLRLIKNIFYNFIGLKIRHPNDTIVKRMIRSKFPEQVDFPITRLGTNAAGLLIGAIETTSQAVTQVIDYLLNHPQILAQAKNVAAADNFKNFDAIIWETLRFVPISPYLFRQTKADVIVAKNTEFETIIKSGTNVLLLTQSAMFDPHTIQDPDIFKAERDSYHHFCLGFGIHECLGKHIAMVMIPEMVRQLLLKEKIVKDSEIDFKDGPFPEELKLSWSL